MTATTAEKPKRAPKPKATEERRKPWRSDWSRSSPQPWTVTEKESWYVNRLGSISTAKPPPASR